MYSQRPSWLEAFYNDSSKPPRLFAWGTSNLASHNTFEASSSLTAPNASVDLEKRIYILGIGNLGRLFASSLAQAPGSPPITLVVHRKDLLTQWVESNGIELVRSGTLEKNKNFNIEWWTESKPDAGPICEVAAGEKLRNLIITTKASAALPQVDRVRGYLDSNCTVAFVQNGMSKLWPPHGPAYVSHRFPAGDAPNFLACVTTHGVTSQGQFRSLHASQADVAVGSVLPNKASSQPSAYLTSQLLEAPHLNARLVFMGELWILQLEKLVVNAIINPLTAILQCKNGALFTEPDGVLAGVIDQLLSEASKVLQLLVSHESSVEVIGHPSLSGSEASSEPKTALDLSPRSLYERFSQPQLKDMVYRVGHKVRENTSSMLQDVRSGRSTEIRDFNGWLVETAAFLDQSLDMAGHRTIVDLVEAGETLDVDRLGERLTSSGAGDRK
ncbi:2-dehydropantoate 2-reductase [Fusarium albosuccineum]|uniref:2-dehydropantoate 2-reductase n=1 Tax=Fusarium albosuccineum TaxID=1237068 RepID=A0A8H4LBL1_9HYPO|nr:2-dehydropantoate 2-reductase [Fusarium albosuccineum]